MINCYSSPQLYLTLLEQDTYVVRTVRRRRKHMSKDSLSCHFLQNQKRGGENVIIPWCGCTEMERKDNKGTHLAQKDPTLFWLI